MHSDAQHAFAIALYLCGRDERLPEGDTIAMSQFLQFGEYTVRYAWDTCPSWRQSVSVTGSYFSSTKTVRSKKLDNFTYI
jgi:hypothetical protein